MDIIIALQLQSPRGRQVLFLKFFPLFLFATLNGYMCISHTLNIVSTVFYICRTSSRLAQVLVCNSLL